MASAVFFLDLKGKASCSTKTPPPFTSRNSSDQKNPSLDPPRPKLQRRHPHVRRRKVPRPPLRSGRRELGRPTLFLGRGYKCTFSWRQGVAKTLWERAAYLLLRHGFDSTSTSDIIISTCSPLRNAIPTPPRSSSFCTKSSRYSPSISKSSRRNRYGTISSSYTSCWTR